MQTEAQVLTPMCINTYDFLKPPEEGISTHDQSASLQEYFGLFPRLWRVRSLKLLARHFSTVAVVVRRSSNWRLLDVLSNFDFTSEGEFLRRNNIRIAGLWSIAT